MKTIYKYALGLGLRMPRGAQLLHLGEQHGDLYVWAKVDIDQPIVWRKLEVVGTGWQEKDGGDGVHIGTVQMHNGLVFHVFDHGELVSPS